MAPIKKGPSGEGPRKPNKIVVTATSVVLVSAVGVGAFALGQGGAEFDPSAFQSAYNQGQDDQRTGYRSTTSETQAQANRKDDGSSNDDKGAETKRKDDSFSKLPAGEQSGSTSYRVSGEGSQAVAINGGDGNAQGSDSGSGNSPVGPLVPGDGNGSNSGDNQGGNTTPGDNGNNGGNSGDNSGGDSSGGADFTPNNPVKPANKVDFSKDPSVKKPDLSGSGYTPITGNDPTTKGLTADMLFGFNEPPYAPTIEQDEASSVSLYVGQKPTAWQVFCALDVNFMGMKVDGSSFDFVNFTWTTTEEKFALYDFFKIDEYPEVIPDHEFDIKGRYRYSRDDEWHDFTFSYQPIESKVFVVSSALDGDGSPKVLGTEPTNYVDKENVHLLRYTESLLKSVGAIDDDGTQSELVMGWMDEDGNEVSFPYKTAINPGRHYYQPSGFAELSSGYIVKPKSYWINKDTYVPDEGNTISMYLQTLVGLEDNGRALSGPKRSKKLVVPTGVNAINFTSDWSVVVDTVEIPSTVIAINMSSDGLQANKKFVVDEGNLNYSTTSDGILTHTKKSDSGEASGTEYLAVPLDLANLSVPSDVTKVHLSKSNKVKNLDLSNAKVTDLDLEYDRLNACNVVVPDDQFGSFIVNHYEDLAAGKNTVAKASNPNERFYVDEGMVYSDDKIFKVLDTSARGDGGVRDLFVSGPHTFMKDCLKGLDDSAYNTYTRTITFADDKSYVLEDGCFEGGAIKKIVCRTQAQYDYVKSRLEAAGAPDAEVVFGTVSKEGHRYYVEEKDGQSRVVLLQAASGLKSFDGTLTAADGEKLSVKEVASRAFANQKQLKWVQLPESVDTVGDEAFKGCTALEGIFEANTDEVSIGRSVLSGLPSLRFVAFRSLDAEFETQDQPNSTCLMYCPTAATGGYTPYFTYFNEESNVTDYEVIELSDGTLVLYGTYINGPWLLLATGSTLPSKVELPSSTREIFSNALEGVGGSFEINWDDLDQLMYVDYAAFKNSGLKGRVCVGTSADQEASVGQEAFYGCKGVTSFESKATKFSLDSSALNELSSLKTVKLAIGDLVYSTALDMGSFYKCSALESIEFTSEYVTQLTLMGSGTGFEFNTDWSQNNDDEVNHLKIKVPEGKQKKYLDSWIYPIAGYTSYDTMHESIARKLQILNNEYPDEIEIKREMSKQLLAAENRLRTMLGMEKVDVSSYLPFDESEGYEFVTSKGVTQLVSAPEDVTVADLGKIELPKGVKSFTISKEAFSKCSKLEKVVVPDCVDEIESEAFEGHDGVEVEITNPDLKLPMDEDKNPFSFGAKVNLVVSEDIRKGCLESWILQSFVTDEDDDGIDDYDILVYAANLWDYDMTEDEFDQAVNGPFMKQENYLRKLMGLDEISDFSQLAYRYDVSDFYSRSATHSAKDGDSVADDSDSSKSSDKDESDGQSKSDKADESSSSGMKTESTKQPSDAKGDSDSSGSSVDSSPSDSSKNDGSSDKGSDGSPTADVSSASDGVEGE